MNKDLEEQIAEAATRPGVLNTGETLEAAADRDGKAMVANLNRNALAEAVKVPPLGGPERHE